jgi:FdhD protein
VSAQAPTLHTTPRIWRGGVAQNGTREVAEETPVALVYDGVSEAVMMATPADLADFAYGFSLNEGLVRAVDDIAQLDLVANADGIEARMTLSPNRPTGLEARHRSRAGPTGCGLCGIDTLSDALQLRAEIAPGGTLTMSAADIHAALASLDGAQPLGARTHAMHAAGFWQPGAGLVALREDVGRHNALDKLAGAMARTGLSGPQGVVVLTSRVSVEMVQKAVVIGSPILVAISAPTALALRTAEAAGLTIVAIARRDGFEVFSHAHRVTG